MVVVSISEDVYHLRGSLGGPQRLHTSVKGAQTALKVTKMTFGKKKSICMRKIDKQAPFLGWSHCPWMD